LADGDITGAFSALAMALNAVVTSLALPLLLAALRW
jgi:putative effector of murein hydrolase